MRVEDRPSVTTKGCMAGRPGSNQAHGAFRAGRMRSHLSRRWIRVLQQALPLPSSKPHFSPRSTTVTATRRQCMGTDPPQTQPLFTGRLPRAVFTSEGA